LELWSRVMYGTHAQFRKGAGLLNQQAYHGRGEARTQEGRPKRHKRFQDPSVDGAIRARQRKKKTEKCPTSTRAYRENGEIVIRKKTPLVGKNRGEPK